MMERYELLEMFMVLLITTTSVLAQEKHAAQGPSVSPQSVHTERQTDLDGRKMESIGVSKSAMVGGNSSVLEQGPQVNHGKVGNVIQVPANCAEGFKMGADGTCREVFE